MAIGLGLILILQLISLLPFLVLGLADLETVRFRYSHGSEKPPGNLPILVKLHAAETRSFRVCLSITIACLLVFFCLPLLIVRVFWPEELFGVFDYMVLPMCFLLPLAICRALHASPDPTGWFSSQKREGLTYLKLRPVILYLQSESMKDNKIAREKLTELSRREDAMGKMTREILSEAGTDSGDMRCCD